MSRGGFHSRVHLSTLTKNTLLGSQHHLVSFLRELEINGGSGFPSLNYFVSLKASDLHYACKKYPL